MRASFSAGAGFDGDTGAYRPAAAGRRAWCARCRTTAASIAEIWQFPVVLIPVGDRDRPDSVVLRPVDSIDGMTAQSVSMDEDLLGSMADRLLNWTGLRLFFTI